MTQRPAPFRGIRKKSPISVDRSRADLVNMWLWLTAEKLNREGNWMLDPPDESRRGAIASRLPK